MGEICDFKEVIVILGETENCKPWTKLTSKNTSKEFKREKFCNF